jgi:HdeA/HdeB family
LQRHGIQARQSSEQEMSVIVRSLVAAALSVLIMSSASAQDLDFSKIKCKDFISAPKDQIGTILAWMEGYYTKENDPPIMHADKTVKDAKALSAYCNEHGDDDIIKAAEKVMPVK